MKTLRISLSIATVAAVLWCGWVLLQRRAAQREWEAQQYRMANPPPTPQFNQTYGGSDLKILNFYASRERGAGQPWLLCYGVLNAKSVRIEPPVAEVYPTVSKCVEARPEKETRYTLIAEDSAGHTASKSLLVPVDASTGKKGSQ